MAAAGSLSNAPAVAIDIACGTGQVVRALLQRGVRCVVGVDVSATHAAEAVAATNDVAAAAATGATVAWAVGGADTLELPTADASAATSCNADLIMVASALTGFPTRPPSARAPARS